MARQGLSAVPKVYFKKTTKCFFLACDLGYYVTQGRCLPRAPPHPRLENVPELERPINPWLAESVDTFQSPSFCPVRAAVSGFFEEAIYAPFQICSPFVAGCLRAIAYASPCRIAARSLRRPVIRPKSGPRQLRLGRFFLPIKSSCGVHAGKLRCISTDPAPHMARLDLAAKNLHQILLTFLFWSFAPSSCDSSPFTLPIPRA